MDCIVGWAVRPGVQYVDAYRVPLSESAPISGPNAVTLQRAWIEKK
jgi:hypothetical protein